MIPTHPFPQSQALDRPYGRTCSCIAKLPSRGLSRDYPSADSLAARAAYTSDRVGVVSLPTHRESNSEGIIDSSTAPLLAPLGELCSPNYVVRTHCGPFHDLMGRLSPCLHHVCLIADL